MNGVRCKIVSCCYYVKLFNVMYRLCDWEGGGSGQGGAGLEENLIRFKLNILLPSERRER